MDALLPDEMHGVRDSSGDACVEAGFIASQKLAVRTPRRRLPDLSNPVKFAARENTS